MNLITFLLFYKEMHFLALDTRGIYPYIYGSTNPGHMHKWKPGVRTSRCPGVDKKRIRENVNKFWDKFGMRDINTCYFYNVWKWKLN